MAVRILSREVGLSATQDVQSFSRGLALSSSVFSGTHFLLVPLAPDLTAMKNRQ
ncbi:hypothetical protein COLO4_28789 [Corchorus olitorius]|uniref:Uncharacterized protein n=1 Tax=Corchorus olitorius TaxID=93759 RepID=A0A1R3HI96_9ROSI|nr:hypothetical protein COLO4_28789 [Corchorus olitorius]